MNTPWFCSIPPVLLLSSIHRFDPHFNAITGLNGSGKSNILDSICFVLGITNLSQVRAGNLSELVYKQGQAGVNKASVTIVFDNEDEASSPVGYEQCKEVNVTRQVLIGGKSKYLINGRNSPAGQVANLFHSVQLNVNNPHFLIMQGRITKVLNMKPGEILGMVEEAAGTRMYENKKATAIKTIEKKQMKVDEINSILSEEITPTLERLRGEKQQYLKWSKNNADIERIERFVVASEYVQAQEVLSKNSEDVAKMEEEVAMYEETMRTAREEVAAKEEEIAKLSEKMNSELEGTHNEAKAVEENKSKDLVKATSAWENKKLAVASASKELEEAKAAVEESRNAVRDVEKNISNKLAAIQKAKDEAVNAEENLKKLQKEYQNLCAGISSEEGDEGRTLPDQISKAYSDANSADAKAKQAQMKIDHLTKSLKVNLSFRSCFIVSILLLYSSSSSFYIAFAPFSLLRKICKRRNHLQQNCPRRRTRLWRKLRASARNSPTSLFLRMNSMRSKMRRSIWRTT